MEEKEITSDTVLTDVKTVATMLKKAGADVRLYLLWKNKKGHCKSILFHIYLLHCSKWYSLELLIIL